eukprot:CAMPEP_0181446908 /NCGR_PEP_ID=MMETSP1110-20121109/26350_1 /TAXON_ID=174948 /ORGANISM="Symbiodinium sp., Strain CCMP421" /LENGTH=66 /DNA_ID=CAMNT_0023571007 /DNA_START=437 /DNA_END=637 /DNA_ORIENTATION=-
MASCKAPGGHNFPWKEESQRLPLLGLAAPLVSWPEPAQAPLPGSPEHHPGLAVVLHEVARHGAPGS